MTHSINWTKRIEMGRERIDRWLVGLPDDLFSDIVFPGWRDVRRGKA